MNDLDLFESSNFETYFNYEKMLKFEKALRKIRHVFKNFIVILPLNFTPETRALYEKLNSLYTESGYKSICKTYNNLRVIYLYLYNSKFSKNIFNAQMTLKMKKQADRLQFKIKDNQIYCTDLGICSAENTDIIFEYIKNKFNEYREFLPSVLEKKIEEKYKIRFAEMNIARTTVEVMAKTIPEVELVVQQICESIVVLKKEDKYFEVKVVHNSILNDLNSFLELLKNPVELKSEKLSCKQIKSSEGFRHCSCSVISFDRKKSKSN